MDARYDVVIAGGGMVGAALGCALGSLPLRIAVVEPAPFVTDPAAGNSEPAATPSFDARTLALSRSSQRILAGLGLWSGLEAGATPIRRIHVSERGRFGNAVIDSREEGVDALGHVVESRAIGQVLWTALRESANLDLIAPGRITAAREVENALQIAVERDGVTQDLSARLLVVADGARSVLRDAIGIAATSRPYGQTAIVGNVEVTRNQGGETAYERFTQAGPLAMLPTGRNRFVFILTRRTEQAPDVLALGDADFLELLQANFGNRLGQLTRVGKRHDYPLELVRAAAITAHRAVIVGNAANGLHPVAGQGYNLSLRDVATLAEVIADDMAESSPGRAGGFDPGDAQLLDRYAQWRRRDQRNVVQFTDGLIRLFDMPGPGIGIVRGLGLAAFDAAPGTKRWLARYAMGLGGRLTRLARGLRL